MKTFQVGRPLSDQILRSSDFELLPTPPIPPIIGSNPANNISQKTWLRAVSRGQPKYQKIIPIDGVFKAIEGTEISWNFIASDPSNKANQTIDATLSYFWRRDGSPITDLNILNDFKGVKNVLITSESCTTRVSGRYVCEVSNQFGVTETKPLDLLVIKLKDYPKLFTNLLINGNADSDLGGWSTDADIVSTRFINKDGYLGSSFPLGTIDTWYRFRKDAWEGEDYIGPAGDGSYGDFAFNQASCFNTLPRMISEWKSPGRGGPQWQTVTPEWMLSRWEYSGTDLLENWDQWNLFQERPQITQNEDRGAFNCFFPGMKWIDQYNKNQTTIGLYNESANQILSYFTRDKIKFLKFGGVQTSKMVQTINFGDLADFIDGNVYGVSHITSQFFSYVGAGITRYQIRVYSDNTNEPAEIYNWYPVSPLEFYNRITRNNVDAKIAVPAGSTIEIVPIIDDVVEVQIDYFNFEGSKIGTDLVNGPTAEDVWAVKEKAYFPLTLHPLFEFFIANDCSIKVFGQTYTTTSALQGLFSDSTPFPQENVGATTTQLNEEPLSATPSTIQNVTDRNALFMLQKFGFVKMGSLYPNFWKKGDGDASLKLNRRNRALADYGAAAMFGVEHTRVVPKFSRSAQITVKFIHKSEAFTDNDPAIKQWDSEYLYLDTYGIDEANSLRFVEYGNPRCGLTKAKFILLPNNFEVSQDYPSYKIPPLENTALGLHKALMRSDEVNTSINLDRGFGYLDVKPENAIAPSAPSPFITQTIINNIENSRLNMESVEREGRTGEPIEEEDGHDHDESSEPG